MPTYPFPTRGFRRTRERASGLLFAFGVDDLSQTLTTGQTLTFARAGGRNVLDSAGRVIALAHSQFPWSAVYNTTEAVYEPVFESMADSANYCLQSENFGTTWVAVGTPTRSAAAKACGVLALDLIGDDAAGTLEGYTQAVTPAGGNGTKGVSFFVAQGTSTTTAFRVRDTTASANRLAGVLTWSSGVPTLTMATGTYLGAVPCAGGVYRLLFQTTTWTVANTNSVEFYPASTSGLTTTETGNLYVGGVCVDKHIYPRAYVKTTTGSVVDTPDDCSATLDWAPQDFTLYLRLARPAWAASAIPAGATQVYFCNGSGSAAKFSVYYDLNALVWTALITDGSTSRSATAAMPSGDVIEVCAQFNNVTTAARVRLDVGADFGSYSSASGAITAWGGSTLYIGENSAGATAADAGIRKLLIAPGALTMAQMRGLNV